MQGCDLLSKGHGNNLAYCPQVEIIELTFSGIQEEEYTFQFGVKYFAVCQDCSRLQCWLIVSSSELKFMVLFQVTKDFELYAALEPLVTKQNAIVYINKLLRWIKSDENRLFILSSPTF